MKIGILVSMTNNFGEMGFYNSQEIGLAKSLEETGNIVWVYKLLKKNSFIPDNYEKGNLHVKFSIVESIGINGLVNTQILDKNLDSLVFFSDTQLSVPKVHKWCLQNSVVMLPYIGVIESHSPNIFIQSISNMIFLRNISVFKKCYCLVKNNEVKERLSKRGVRNITLAPVGIDLDVLNHEYIITNINELKKNYGFSQSDKIILFIGRLEEEKRPLDLVNVFEKLYKVDQNYRLLIVGKGSLYNSIISEITNKNLLPYFKYIEKIPNHQVWELYRIAEAFVNLNKQEIFGMVLLEAMFYETKVVAFHAPGPDFIIVDKISGILVNNEDQMIDAILADYPNIKNEAHKRVVESLTWSHSANIITKLSNISQQN